MFLNSAASLAVDPDDCLVVEDSIHGVEAAMRAGMACVAVGDVIHSAAYRHLLHTSNGLPVLGVETLGDLTWAQVESMDGTNR